MSQDPINDLLSKIESQSLKYQQLSTAVSNYIIVFQERLGRLPGKIQIGLKGESGDILEFTRAGSDWVLLYTSADTSETNLVHKLPVEKKLEAIKLFQPLLSKLLKIAEERAGDLAQALSKITPLAGISSKEGA